MLRRLTLRDVVIVAELDGVLVGSAGLHPATQLRRRHTAARPWKPGLLTPDA